jgi:hypothetical protein
MDIEGFPLGHVEAPNHVNEPLLVKPLLDRVLGKDRKVELLAGDRGFESRECSTL